jgi:hypothetical protein
MQDSPIRDGYRHWSWPLPAAWGLGDGAHSNDLPRWRQALVAEAERLGLQLQTLGTALGEPLWLLTRSAGAPQAAQRLVACGFHGEEPAGPWGLLKFLQGMDPAGLDGVHLTLLPLVNCTGFAAGTRFNAEGDNPNRGFVDDGSGGGPAPSAEGRLLLQHAATLASASRNGVLSCHEDVLVDTAYIYALESADQPGPWARRLLQANLRHFGQHPDGLVDGCRVHDGIVFNHHDGSFEDWLFGLGAAFAACVETPGLQAFEDRVAAHSDMIAAFVQGPSPAP